MQYFKVTRIGQRYYIWHRETEKVWRYSYATMFVQSVLEQLEADWQRYDDVQRQRDLAANFVDSVNDCMESTTENE